MTSSPGVKTCGAFRRSMANTSPAGGRTRPLCRSARSQAAGGVLRRKPGATHRRGPSANSGKARPAERYYYEYRRNGTVNLFVLLDVHRPWRKVKVTERRAAKDYAQCMRDLVDIHYPEAEIIRSCWIIFRPTPPAPLSDVPPRRSQADLATARVPPHPQARKLAQHGRDRDRRPARPVPRSRIDDPSDYAAKTPPGSEGEMPPAPASNGCSQQTRPAPKWAAPIPPLPKKS